MPENQFRILPGDVVSVLPWCLDAFRLQSLMRLNIQFEHMQLVQKMPCQSKVGARFEIGGTGDFRQSTKIIWERIFWRVNESDARGPVTDHTDDSSPDKSLEIPGLTGIHKPGKKADDREGGFQRLRRSRPDPLSSCGPIVGCP